MPRVKRGTVRRAKRKKLLSRAKGFFQTKSKLYRAAKEAVDTALKYAFVGRRRKKRDFRRLWIVRINAAARENGLSYSALIQGLDAAGAVTARSASDLRSIGLPAALSPAMSCPYVSPFSRAAALIRTTHRRRKSRFLRRRPTNAYFSAVSTDSFAAR
jgi:large subunit ribosomal protein L20